MAETRDNRRTFILGLDAAVPELIDRFIADGRLPNIAKLIDRGAYAQPYPALPTHTPVNWATVSTGAWPGSHGITGFSMIDKNGPLDTTLSGFDTRELQVPTLWNVAARSGLKSLLLKWAGPTFPVNVENGAQIDGCFCVACEHEIAGPALFSDDVKNGGRPIDWKSAIGFSDVPPSTLPPLSTELVLGNDTERRTLHALLYASGPDYDSVLLATSPSANESLCVLEPGGWTPWRKLAFAGGRTGTVRLKWFRTTGAGAAAKPEIFVSQIMPITGWCEPDGLTSALVENAGPFLQRPGYNQRGVVYGAWAGYDTLLEEIEYQHLWYSRAMQYLCDRDDYDLVFLHTHAPDYIQDAIMPEAEPLTSPDDETAARSLEYVAETYESCDRMIGRIIDEIASPDDHIAVVSDHGCIGYPEDERNHHVLTRLLEESGFLSYLRGEKSTQAGSKPGRGRVSIDWSRTKAIFSDSIHVYLNVEGRQPGGIVSPEEFDKVRDDLIELLRGYRDPLLGRCPFSLIVKGEDAAILGLYGDRIGDLIVCSRPGALYGEGHGTILPTAEYGISSNHATFIVAGPSVRRGVRVERPCSLVDIAPTIAEIMHIPPWDTCQGTALHAVLEESR